MNESVVPGASSRRASRPIVCPRRWTGAAIFTALLMTCTLSFRSRSRGFDREAWIEDYLQLRGEVARSYANLEWSVATGRIDPYRLNVTTLRALGNAATPRDARRALLRFVKAFHDPHLALLRPDAEPLRGRRPSGDAVLPGPAKAAGSACRMIGVRENPDAEMGFVLPWGKRNFHPLPARGSFPAGILTVGDRRFGVLRIGSFEDANYVDACLNAWPAFRKRYTGPCKADCESRFRIAFHSRLLEDLASRISELTGAGVNAILVDVTGNHGGHDWYLQAARLLTPRTIPARRSVFLRQEAATSSLHHDLETIFSSRDSKQISVETRRWLEEGRSRVKALMEETRRPCEREGLFLRAGHKLPCSGLVSGDYYEDGPFALLPSEIWIPEALKLRLFDSYWGAIPEGSWTGPLLLLVDRETGSAGELFALVLHEAGAAIIVGERSAGAGGGFTFGQGELILAHSRIRATIPNSVALFKDGRNAREGVEPDICVDWAPTDSRSTRTLKLLRVLERL